MENDVKKVLRVGNTINFIIKTEEDTDFWFWQVSEADVFDYFAKMKGIRGAAFVYQIASGNITPECAEMFVNDPENGTLGCSCGGYDTIEEVIEELLR